MKKESHSWYEKEMEKAGKSLSGTNIDDWHKRMLKLKEIIDSHSLISEECYEKKISHKIIEDGPIARQVKRNHKKKLLI